MTTERDILQSLIRKDLVNAIDNKDQQNIERIIDDINALKLDGEPIIASRLQPANVDHICPSKLTASARKAAEALVLKGAFAVHFNFGGAATRLKQGPMYALKIGDIAEQFGRQAQPASSHDLAMGPRQLKMYAHAIWQLNKRPTGGIARCLQYIPIVIHVNQEIAEDVADDLVENDFYDFNPANVFLLADPVFPGYSLNKSGITLNDLSKHFPPGHGYALEQLARKGQVHKIRDGKLQQQDDSLLQILGAKGVEVIRTHRINDLTLWTEEVLSIERLAYFLDRVQQQHVEVGIEMADNPGGQKGGNFVQIIGTDRGFLVETIATKTSSLSGILRKAFADELPYNSFRNFYSVAGLRRILREHALPRYLRYREGHLYTEMITGDITQLPNASTVAFRFGDKPIIHDFKEEEDIDDALEYERKSNKILEGS